MFYSHDILTSRKYGIATIWLVATLGQKTVGKKISRKAILEVNVPKACETIIAPETPLALRLQSNLLYGVARVYYQQCSYVLADAQIAQNHIKAVMNARTTNLDASPYVRKRPQDLLMQEGDMLMTDLTISSFDLNLLSQQTDLSWAIDEASLHTSQYSLTRSFSGQGNGELIIPSDSSHQEMHPFNLAGDDDFGLGIHARTSELAHGEEEVFFPVDDIQIDAEGNVIEGPKTPLPRTAVPGKPNRDDSSRIHSDAYPQAGEPLDLYSDSHQANLVPELPELQSSALSDLQTQPTSSSFVLEEIMEEADGIPLRRRKTLKPIPVDRWTIRTTTQREQRDSYLETMRAAAKEHLVRRMPHQARKNAEHWILGMGLNGIGITSARNIENPLAMFSGNNLYELITGMSLKTIPQKRGGDSDPSDFDRRVRSRHDDALEQAHAYQQEDNMINMNDDIELARTAAQRELEEPSSAMPWNISASIRGSSLPPGFIQGSSTARPRSRLVSASPLAGRGAPMPLEEDIEFEDIDELQLDMPQPLLGSELSNLAAPNDREGASLRSDLDKDSRNFLGYVQECFMEIQEDEDQRAAQLGGETRAIDKIFFETLLPPASNSCAVAAMGLMHVLTLATKNLVQVAQDRRRDDYAPIVIIRAV